MNKHLVKIIFTLSFLFSIFAIAYSSDDTATLQAKDRMDQRLPSIIALKDKGVIGEDSNGYLAFVGSSREGQDIVNAENADRRTVYQLIAKQTGSTTEAVAKMRAERLVGNASKGHYYKINGKWVKK